MSKKWIGLLGLLGVAAMVLYLWTGAGRDRRGAEQGVSKATDPKVVRMSSTASDLRVADVDTLVADDRVGNLRLEGQVVDENQEPVAGAEVSISSNPTRVATSAEDGSFHFDQLVGRTYSLVASSQNGAAGPVSAQLRENSDPVILHVRPAASIAVTVLTSADRQPVGNATVELRGLMTRSVTTDARGVARLTGVPPGFYQIAASAPGYGLAQQPQRIGGGAATFESELLLKVGAAVSGVVRNSQGATVADAQVVYSSASERFSRADSRYDAQTTDAEGRFSFAALPAGTFRFTARHATYAPGESEPMTLTGTAAVDNVEITVQEGAVLAGRVVDESGRAAALAAVRVSTEGEGRRWAPPRQVYSDDDGRFEMTGLAPKPVSVLALHERATSETYAADLSEQPVQRDIELVLGLSGVIAGTVTDSSGEPVDGAQLRLRPDFRAKDFSFTDMRLRGMASGVSDSGGQFEFRGLADGTYSVMATPPGSEMSFRRGRGRRGGENEVEARVGDTDVKVVLQARGAIVGKVAFANGTPPAAFTLSLGGRGRAMPFGTEDGSFRLGDLEPGTYQPRLSGPDFDQGRVPEVEVVAGKDVDVGTIIVAQGRTLSGKVLSSSGRAVANATVIAGARLRGTGSSSSGGGFRGGGGGSKSVTTDETGAFLIRGLGRGALVLAAEHETEGRSAPIVLPATAESSSDLQLQLLPTGALEGTVTLDGSPADSATVRVQSQEVPGANYAVSTGADGRFRFDVLAPGPYLVSAEVGNPRSGQAATSKTVTVQSEKLARVDLVMSLGEVTLMVTAVGEGLDFATVDLVAGEVTASTAAELERALANHPADSSAFAIIFGGQAGEVKNLKPGRYTVCVTPYPDGVVGRQSRAYLSREATRLPVYCQPAVVTAAPAEQALAIDVSVPEFVPEEDSSPDGEE